MKIKTYNAYPHDLAELHLQRLHLSIPLSHSAFPYILLSGPLYANKRTMSPTRWQHTASLSHSRGKDRRTDRRLITLNVA